MRKEIGDAIAWLEFIRWFLWRHSMAEWLSFAIDIFLFTSSLAVVIRAQHVHRSCFTALKTFSITFLNRAIKILIKLWHPLGRPLSLWCGRRLPAHEPRSTRRTSEYVLVLYRNVLWVWTVCVCVCRYYGVAYIHVTRYIVKYMQSYGIFYWFVLTAGQ